MCLRINRDIRNQIIYYLVVLFVSAQLADYSWWMQMSWNLLTHWGRVMHICIDNLTTNDSVNGLSPGRCQAFIWSNAGILVIKLLGTNPSEIVIETLIFPFKKMHLKMSSGKCQPWCLGLNVFIQNNFFSWITNLLWNFFNANDVKNLMFLLMKSFFKLPFVNLLSFFILGGKR